MDPSEIITQLDALAQLHAALDEANIQKKALVDSVITPEIKLKLTEIDAEFEDLLVTCGEKIAEAEATVKAAVVGAGESIKGAHMQAVYSVGRAHWDDRKLVKYAETHKEILICRDQGPAYVTLRWLGK
jgi:hypothetical protein